VAISSVASIYASLASRPWTPDELEARFDAADLRGIDEQLANEARFDRPIGRLVTAIRYAINLAGAVQVLHVMPSTTHRRPDGRPLLDHIYSIIDESAAGMLHRCHLALTALGDAWDDPGATPGEWLPHVYEQTAEALPKISNRVQPPSLIEHAQEAGYCAALAIETIDRESPLAPEMIADSLTHLLVVCVFADAAAGREP